MELVQTGTIVAEETSHAGRVLGRRDTSSGAFSAHLITPGVLLRKPALFCGCDDGTLVGWFREDIKRNDKPWLRFAAHSAGVTSLDYMHDYGLVVTSSTDSTVKVWDLWRSATEREKPVQTLTGHGAGVVSCCYLVDMVMSASRDQTVRIWRRDSGREMLHYPWFTCSQVIKLGDYAMVSVDVWPSAVTALMIRSTMLAKLFVGSSGGELFLFEKTEEEDGATGDKVTFFEPKPLGTDQQGAGQQRLARVVAKLGVHSLEVLPADNILIVLGNDHTAQVLDANTMERRLHVVGSPLTRFTDACFKKAQQELVLVRSCVGNTAALQRMRCNRAMALNCTAVCRWTRRAAVMSGICSRRRR